MLAYVNRAQITVTSAQLVRQKFPKEMLSAVLDENMGELVEYTKLMKNPKNCPLYKTTMPKKSEDGRRAYQA